MCFAMHIAQLLTNEWYAFGADDTTRKEMKVVLCPFDHYSMACIISSLQGDKKTWLSHLNTVGVYCTLQILVGIGYPKTSFSFRFFHLIPFHFILFPSEIVMLALICPLPFSQTWSKSNGKEQQPEHSPLLTKAYNTGAYFLNRTGKAAEFTLWAKSDLAFSHVKASLRM